MASLSSIKPFVPFLLTFIIPRGISYFRSVKIAIKTRPPPCSLPTKASRALNILFLSICLFFLMSCSPYLQDYQPNFFEVTKSRFHVPTDALFTRLSLIRPLTPADEALRGKITTPISRILYLRYGPRTITGCPFCNPTDPVSYGLHYLPVNILLPHLVHLLLVGLATSAPIAGKSTKTLFRTKFVLGALVLASLDVYLSVAFPILVPNPQSPYPPKGIYWTALILRPLVVCLFDIFCATLMYAAVTNRLPFLFLASSSGATTEGRVNDQQRQLHSLISTTVALQTALTKLRACNVARNVVVRDVHDLKRHENDYWRVVADMEGLDPAIPACGSGTHEEAASIWEEEEVMEALARVTKGGDGKGLAGLDVEKMRKEAGIWVDSVTAGLVEDQ